MWRMIYLWKNGKLLYGRYVAKGTNKRKRIFNIIEYNREEWFLNENETNDTISRTNIRVLIGRYSVWSRILDRV